MVQSACTRLYSSSIGLVESTVLPRLCSPDADVDMIKAVAMMLWKGALRSTSSVLR